MGLIEFLLARIEEDRDAANSVYTDSGARLTHVHSVDYSDMSQIYTVTYQSGEKRKLDSYQYRDEFMTHTPNQRKLREAKFKENVIAVAIGQRPVEGHMRRILMNMSTVYKDHPDYKEEWV